MGEERAWSFVSVWNGVGRLQRQRCTALSFGHQIVIANCTALSFLCVTHSDAAVDGTWYLFPIFMLMLRLHVLFFHGRKEQG